jgi:hypothetical protein
VEEADERRWIALGLLGVAVAWGIIAGAVVRSRARGERRSGPVRRGRRGGRVLRDPATLDRRRAGIFSFPRAEPIPVELPIVE